MTRKSKKRLSILKKAVSSEESSLTFTKINRRISFSGKKSIKEFTSDDNKMTIWGNSYEESAEMIQSASHHTLVTDSTIFQSRSETTQCSKTYLESVDKENEKINLRSRKVLKRKSNVLKAITVQPATKQKDVTPNIETIEMDISLNENDNKSQKRISVGKFVSPNLTPVPPHKISKLNQTVEETSSEKYLGGRRISDELFSEANFSIPSRILERGDVNLTYGFNLSEFDILQMKPHRPSENVTSFATKIDRLNFSDEDKPHNEDNSVMLKIQNPQIEQMRITGTIVTATEQNLDISIDISDGSKVFDNLRQSISTKLKQVEMAEATTAPESPPAPESPKANPVLEMFKIHNQLKKRMATQFEEKLEKECIVPFTSAKFETPFMPNFISTNPDTNVGELGSNRHTIEFSNKELGLTKMKENKKRETILFAKDSANLDMSLSEEYIDSGPKSKRSTIHFQNDNLENLIICEPESTKQEPEMSLVNKLHVYPVTEFSMQNLIQNKFSDRGTIYFQNNDLNINESSRFDDEIKKVKDTSRSTINFSKQAELETSLAENYNFTVNEENARKTKRATINYPNQDLEMTTIETAQNIKAGNTSLNITEAEKAIEQLEIRTKRETIHFPNQRLDISTIESSPNVKDDNIKRNLKLPDKLDEKFESQLKRGTIHFPSQELDFSVIKSSPNKKNENEIEAANVSENPKAQNKRGTIHFSNRDLETSIDESENLILTEAPKFSEKHEAQIKRGTIYFPKQAELETSLAENYNFSVNEENARNTKRATIHYPNQDLEMTTIEAAQNIKAENTSLNITEAEKAIEQLEIRTKRDTIHFPNQRLEISNIDSSPNVKDDNIKRNLKLPDKLDEKFENQLKRGTIHFTSQELEFSVIESSLNKKDENGTDASKVSEKPKAQNKRGTIHFSNRDLQTSIIDESENLILTEESKFSEKQAKLKRCTIHYPNQELDVSTVDSFPNIKEEESNLALTVDAKPTEKYDGQTKRGTIYFRNQELETSVFVAPVNQKVKECEERTKRGTIHFPNQQLEMTSVEPSPKLNTNYERQTNHENQQNQINRGTIHFPNYDLQTSLANDSVKENGNSIDDPKFHKEKATETKRATIHFPNQPLEMSLTESNSNLKEEDINESLQVKAKLGDSTNFQNQEIQESTIELCSIVNSTEQNKQTELGNIHFSIGKKLSLTDAAQQIKRGTVYFTRQELETSMIDLVNQTRISKVSPKMSARHETQTKRGTIHFPNQQLDMSTVEPHPNEKNKKKCEKPAIRGTIHFPEQELDLSTVESVSNVKGQNTNLNLKRATNASTMLESSTKRETILFANQEIDSSLVVECVDKHLIRCEEHTHQSNRGTIHFPQNQQLEMSNFEPSPNTKAGHRNLNLIVTAKINEKCERKTKRETLHFPNQELEMSATSYPNQKSEGTNSDISSAFSDKLKGSTKRGTVYFQSEELENSMVIESNALSAVKSNTNTPRKTIYFHTQQALDISLADLDFPNTSEDEQIKAKMENRAKTYFVNEGLDASMEEVKQIKPANSSRRPILCTNENDFDISIQEPAKYLEHAMDFDMSAPENNSDTSMARKIYPRTPLPCKKFEINDARELDIIQPQPLIPGTIYYEDKTLDLSEFEIKSRHTLYVEDKDDKNLDNSDIEPKIESIKQPSRSTIYFPNQRLDISKTGDAEQRDTSTLESTREKQLLRGTIHYVSDDLETTQSSENQSNKNNNMGAIPKSVNPVITLKENTHEYNRHTIHYQNQDLETTLPMNNDNSNVKHLQHRESEMDKLRGTIHFRGTDLNDFDMSAQPILTVDHSEVQRLMPVTERFQSRVKELEEQIFGQRRSANVSRIDQELASKTCPKSYLDFNDKTNTNIEDLNMTNDFNENRINQQSTMNNLTHIIQFINENKTNAEKSDSINLDSEEMDLSTYEKPDEQLANDLSGLKLSGQDSTDFENNTQALCNLDPKRIYCESKYDAINVTTNSKSENEKLATKRSFLPLPIRKSDAITSHPNMSTRKLVDETMLQDLVPRCDPKTFHELLEITAHLPEENKTRKEICNDFINLTISRFSHSFANSSNIDETSLQLVNSLDELEEVEAAEKESNILDLGIKYVEIEDANLIYQNIDAMLTRKKTRHVPVLDLTKCQELLNQPSFSEIANEFKLKNLIESKRVSELHEPMMGPEKPSLRFLMNNCREQMIKEFSEKNRKEFGIAPFLPLTPKITTLLQNKLAERTNYWTCHDNFYNHGIIVFTHHRVPCMKIKMLFDFFEENEFGELVFTNVIPMMSKTKIISSTFELMQHLQFFKNVPSDMKNMCRRSNEILDFLDSLDRKIITKNYENIQKLKEIVVSTNSKIWHENDTGQCGITKSIVHKRNIYDIIIKISDLQITDILDVTVKPKVPPTTKVKDLTRGLDFLQKLLETPRDYFNF